MMIGTALAEVEIAVAFAAAGVAFASGYFVALRWAVTFYCRGERALSVGALTIGRLAAAIGFFALAVRCGAFALLAALAGFLVVRTYAVRAARRLA